MLAIVRKVHIYAGLLTFAHFIVYGIAGLVATFHSMPVRPKVIRQTRYVEFTAPPSSTDRQVADLVYARLQLPLTRPMPDFALRRDAGQHLLLDFYNVNGIHRVTVLESEGRLKIEEIQNDGWLFLQDIHAATPGDEGAPPLVKLWAWWNEAAMWTLAGFCLSGLWLWLATRPRFVWAWTSLGAGAAALALFWLVFRV